MQHGSAGHTHTVNAFDIYGIYNMNVDIKCNGNILIEWDNQSSNNSQNGIDSHRHQYQDEIPAKSQLAK